VTNLGFSEPANLERDLGLGSSFVKSLREDRIALETLQLFLKVIHNSISLDIVSFGV
jgi:hypothetical protein